MVKNFKRELNTERYNMKLRYVAKTKRRYAKLGKEFPNQDNTIEVDDNLGNILLTQKVGQDRLWELDKNIKRNIAKEENNDDRS